MARVIRVMSISRCIFYHRHEVTDSISQQSSLGRSSKRSMLFYPTWNFSAQKAEASFSYQTEIRRILLLNILWHLQAQLLFFGEYPDTCHYDNFTQAQLRSFSCGRYSWKMYSHFLGLFMSHRFKNKSVQSQRILTRYPAALRPSCSAFTWPQ